MSSTGNLSRYFYNWTKDAYIFKLELVRYAVLIVYSFGFGVPTALYFVMKFLGITNLSLPDVLVVVKLDHLHIWVLFQLLYSNILVVHNPSASFAMAPHCLWNDKHDNIFDFQSQVIFIGVIAPENVFGVRSDSGRPNCSIFNIQVSLLQDGVLRKPAMIKSVFYISYQLYHVYAYLEILV